MELELEKGLEPGTYEAKVSRVENITTRYGEALRIEYKTSTGGKVSEVTSLKYSDKSKLGKRVKVILGHLPSKINLDDIVDKPVIIKVDNEEDSDFPKVVSVSARETTNKEINSEEEEDIPF